MVSVGTNLFVGVDFPIVVGNRYIHIGRHPSGDQLEPEVRVLRWDAETKTVREEPTSGARAALTWEHDANVGAIRFRVNRTAASDIEGYAVGGPLDSMVIVVTPNSFQIMSNDETMAELASNMIVGSDVGVRVDPATGGVALGASLPEGFQYRFRYEEVAVKIASMVDAQVPLLKNREFVRCRIDGPALLGQAGPIGLDNCHFGGPGIDPSSIVWEVPPSGQAYGAVLLSNVVFSHCNFVAVGIAAAEGTREALLEQLTGSQPT